MPSMLGKPPHWVPREAREERTVGRGDEESIRPEPTDLAPENPEPANPERRTPKLRTREP
jgi:hypothetical protein